MSARKAGTSIHADEASLSGWRKELVTDAAGCEIFLYRHDDPAVMDASIAFRVFGFKLCEFDQWLAHIASSDSAKVELLERRRMAMDALRAGKTDRTLRHLEWMLNLQREIAHMEALLPAARAGVPILRGNRMANEQRHADSEAQRAAWQVEADRLWADPQHALKSTKAIAALIADKLGGNANTIRRKLASRRRR